MLDHNYPSIFMKILGLLLILIGCGVLYCCHPNQSLLKQPLAKTYRGLGIIFSVSSLLILWWVLPKVVAVLSWLICITVVWSFLPFVPLFKQTGRS